MFRFSFTFAVLLALGPCFPAFGQEPPPATFSATWQDRSDNEDGFRVVQTVPALTPRPVMCEGGPNVRSCTWVSTDVSRRCFAVYAYNGAGVSADSPQVCTGLPIAPNNLNIIITLPTARVIIRPVPAPRDLGPGLEFAPAEEQTDDANRG